MSHFVNPYYFMYAYLVDPVSSEDGALAYLKGTTASSLYHAKDIHENEVGMFVFPDLSVEVAGRYRLQFQLFEIIG